MPFVDATRATIRDDFMILDDSGKRVIWPWEQYADRPGSAGFVTMPQLPPHRTNGLLRHALNNATAKGDTIWAEIRQA